MTMIGTILAIVVMVLLFIIALLIMTRPEVVTITDDLPKDNRNTSKVMKLSNELAEYIYEENGKVCIKVVKK